MADTIKIKGGEGTVPTLGPRELGYSIDEKTLYIGTTDGNVKLCDATFTKSYVDALVAEINARIDALTNPNG